MTVIAAKNPSSLRVKLDVLMLYGKSATKDDIDNILKTIKVGMMMAPQKDND